MRLVLLGIAVLLGSGCANALDRYLLRHPIEEALTLPDVDLACGSANGNIPVAKGISDKHPAHRSLTILEVTGAACPERRAMEAELDAARAVKLLEGAVLQATVKDARENERRYRADAARRLWRAWANLEAEYGPVGEECPTLRKEEDEFTYLLGLVGGANALLQDQASGGQVGVPTNILGLVGRGARCLDSARWWELPAALEAGSWAMVPGRGPEGVDPWLALSEAAARGDASGVRVGRAIQAQLAANAGRRDDLTDAIKGFAAATAATPSDPDYALLDVYAEMVVRHQSDLVWTEHRGYRARALGELPWDAAEADPDEPDPFGGDPFADDPFADDTPPTDVETPQ